MPWCSQCGTEYDPGVATCVDCGAPIVDTPPSSEDEAPVVILEAGSAVEAQIAEATLEAEGIPAYVQPSSSYVPNVDPTGDEPPELAVLVAPRDVERARAVLSEAPLSEEELTAAEESGPLGEPEE